MTCSERVHKYFSPLDGVYSGKAQHFQFVNEDDMELDREGENEVDVEDENEGTEVDEEGAVDSQPL